jgi:hypothetical protein
MKSVWARRCAEKKEGKKERKRSSFPCSQQIKHYVMKTYGGVDV